MAANLFKQMIGEHMPAWYNDETGTSTINWSTDGGTETTTEYIYIYVHSSVEDLLNILPSVPKGWKWYDIFRVLLVVKVLPILSGVRAKIRRVQERVCARQRAKQKRRMFVQKIYA